MLSRHHILNERSAWTSRPDAKDLRSTTSLIPSIDREVHDSLHAACPSVPLLGWHTLRAVNGLFVPTGRTLTDIDLLRTSIDKATKHPKAHQLERDLGGLTIEAIGLQRPYIIEGIIGNRRIVA